MIRHPPRFPLFPYTTLFRSADRCEPFRQLLEAEAGVYQHARFFSGNQRTVGGTAAREHAEFDDGRFSRSTAPPSGAVGPNSPGSEEHTSELQSRQYLVCRLL